MGVETITGTIIMWIDTRSNMEKESWNYDKQKASEKSAGLKFDDGKEPLSLLSAVWLRGTAKVLAYGANKYTKYGECSCHVNFVTELASKLEAFVDHIMTNGYINTIRNIEPNNERIKNSGISIIKKLKKHITKPDTLNDKKILYSENNAVSPLTSEIIKLAQQSLKVCLQDPATYVEAISILELITITPQGMSVVDYVTHATSILGGLKKSGGWQKHWHTCEIHQVVSQGKHNWRKGIQYSRLLDAAQRHILAFQDGEDLDPETKLLHIYHASCCLMFLAELHELMPEMDDRYKRGENE